MTNSLFSKIKNWKIYLHNIKTKISLRYNRFMENFAGFFNFLRACRVAETDKTVLLVEFNAWHGETLPGYVKYFQDLGYSVVVVTKRSVYKEDPFCRMKKKAAACLYEYMQNEETSHIEGR